MQDNATERNGKPEAGNEALRDALDISFRILRFVLVSVVLVYLFSGVFIVRQDEKAFVLVFGRATGTGADRLRGPGLHWTLPRPFGEVVRVATEKVRPLETASFWPAGEGTAPARATLRPGEDGYTLTGDANLMHSRWVLRYTVADPAVAAFDIVSLDRVLRDELDRAVIIASARFPVDAALRGGIEDVRSAVQAEVRRRCEALGLGVDLQRLDVLQVVPPRQVAAAFDAVVEAEQEQSRLVSAARAAALRMENEARGGASQIRSAGEAHKRRFVSEVSADADYFERIYVEYRKNPKITLRTLRQDTLRRALSRVDQKYVIHETGAGRQEIRLLLGAEGAAPGEVHDEGGRKP